MVPAAGSESRPRLASGGRGSSLPAWSAIPPTSPACGGPSSTRSTSCAAPRWSTGRRSGSCTRTGAATRGRRSPSARWRLANALRGLGLARHDRVAVLSPNAPLILEAHFGVPAAGRSSSPSTPGWPAPRSATSSSTAARASLLVDHELAALVEPLALGRRERRALRRHAARPDCPYETLLAAASPDRAGALARATRRSRSRSTTPRAPRAGRRACSTRYRGAYLNALASARGRACSPSPCTCGRCRCSTATAGASRGPSPLSAATHVTMRKVDPARDLAS